MLSGRRWPLGSPPMLARGRVVSAAHPRDAAAPSSRPAVAPAGALSHPWPPRPAGGLPRGRGGGEFVGGGGFHPGNDCAKADFDRSGEPRAPFADGKSAAAAAAAAAVVAAAAAVQWARSGETAAGSGDLGAAGSSAPRSDPAPAECGLQPVKSS